MSAKNRRHVPAIPRFSRSVQSQSASAKATPVKCKRPKTARWLLPLLGLGGVAIVSATAGALLAVSISSMPLLQNQLSVEESEVFAKEGSISSAKSFRLPELTRPVNILVLGIKVTSADVTNPPAEVRDLGYHALVNSFDGQADTMMLLRFNPSTKQFVVLSIPRDTRTWVDGVGETKLNSANAYGGPALSAQATSDLLGGVAIDRYVRINVQGVEKLIDALGGVQVNVPHDMQYTDHSQHLYINLKAGSQKLDGKKAMQFLRFRYDEFGDVGRVQRQQSFMRALVEQTLNPVTIARLPKILSIIQSHIDTNLSVEELVALVGFASQTNRSNVQMLMVPGRFSEPDEYDLSYWIPDLYQLDELTAQYFNFGAAGHLESASPGYLRVAIQDSTGEPNAVQELVDDLYSGGYSNVFVDRDWNEGLNITRIVAQQGDIESAEAIRRYLGFGEVRIESTGNLRSDITIQVGRDWLQRISDRL